MCISYSVFYVLQASLLHVQQILITRYLITNNKYYSNFNVFFNKKSLKFKKYKLTRTFCPILLASKASLIFVVITWVSKS